MAFLRPNARRHTTFATNFVDLVRGRLLDVVPGRSGGAVHAWLATRPEEWLAGVGTVAIDPFRGYANGVAVHLAHARLVVDPFYAVALPNRAIDDVGRPFSQVRERRRYRVIFMKGASYDSHVGIINAYWSPWKEY